MLIGVLVTTLSYFRWQTPVTAIQDKLGVEGWVRYASLDVDNAVGEQCDATRSDWSNTGR